MPTFHALGVSGEEVVVITDVTSVLCKYEIAPVVEQLFSRDGV